MGKKERGSNKRPPHILLVVETEKAIQLDLWYEIEDKPLTFEEREGERESSLPPAHTLK